jgi:hypothetical protein
MTTTVDSQPQGPPAHSGGVKSWLVKVFELNPAGINWKRGVTFLDIALVPLVVLVATGYEQYLLSAIFAVFLALLADPGGGYGSRVWHIAVYGLIGAALTALGFALGGTSWGWLALAAFVVTLLAGLAIRLGLHRFVAALLLNLWFIIALALAVSFHHHTHITSYTWAQTVTWVGGTALWIAFTFVAWLVLGRKDRPQPVAEIPGDTSQMKLSRPLIAFAVLRAIAIGASVAIAFGLDLSHGLWLPIAALVAMKPSLNQTTLAGVQRIAGALIGAAAAGLLLLIPANEHGLRLLSITHVLEVVALVLLVHAVAIRLWNYALYYSAITAGVLILLDLPQPSNYGNEGDRVLWALCGVGIGVLVMLLGGLLAKRTAKAPPRPASQPA